MLIYTILSILMSFSVMIGMYVFSAIKKTYNREEIFTNKLLYLWYTMWAFHHISLVLASFFGLWPILIDKTATLIGGVILFGVGAIILPMGMIEFRSLQRSTGQDISKLITTGIYKWSRNPQFIGWLLMLLGLSLIGRSGLAFMFTGIFSIVIYLYTIFMAEPYLERLYEEDYRSFKVRTARWVGIPKKK